MMRRLRSLAAVLATVAVASAVAALASLAPGSPLVASCAGAGSNHAALAVEHGDGSVVTRCVAFDTTSVTGEWLLNTSGVAWSGQTFGGFGEAVCALDGEPAHFTDCPGKDNYWAVFVARGGGSWQLANVGISSLTLGDGDAEGFRYVPAVGTPIAPSSPAGVCAGAPASAVASATATTATTATRAGGSPALVSATPAIPAATDSAGSAVSIAAGTDAVAAVPVGSPPGVGRPATVVPAAPIPGSGLDLGLVAAAVVGGGLAGLALLRVMAARRSP